MFTTSKTKDQIKELEQKLLTKQGQVERYMQAFGEIAARKSRLKKEFERVEKERGRLDGSLNDAAEAVREVRTSEQQRTRQETELLAGFTALSEEMEQSAKNGISLQKGLKDQEKDMLALTEHNKHFTEPIRILSQISGELKQEMEQMEACFLQMQEFGRQMGVLSLNAAIEAGRMGESGAKFVGAAEEVRSLAGQYQEAAETMNGQAGKIAGRLDETQERVGQLEQLLQENNTNMGKTTKSLTEFVGRLIQEEPPQFAFRTRELTEEFSAVILGHAKDGEGIQAALSAMELSGERFAQEQQAMNALKEQWDAMKKQIETVK